MQLHLSKCKIEQLDELLELSRKTFIDAFAHLNDPKDFNTYLKEAFTRGKMKEELENPASSFYLVSNQNQTAGYFKLNESSAQTDINDPESLEIERIYVLEEYQGKKIGQWMLKKIEEMAGDMGKTYIWLGVWKKNVKAVRFYQSFGFKSFGEHPYFIGEDKQIDWLMRLDIATLRDKYTAK